MQEQGAGDRASTSDFRIGDWLIQPSLSRLSCGGRTLHLRPRLMDLLAYLAQNAGTVVSKERLIEAVWARRFMAESVLTRSMAELRQTLGDDARSPRLIETIPKRGYRLVAAVETIVRGGEPREARGAPCTLVYGDRVVPLPGGESIIGRDVASWLRIDSPQVSRRHARIVVAFGRAVLEDLGSKNGTYLRGRLLEAPTELADGDRIGVGPALLVFREVGIPGTTAPASAGS